MLGVHEEESPGEPMTEKKKQFERVVKAFKRGPEIHINIKGKETIRIDICAGKGYLPGTDIDRQGALDLVRALNDGLAALR